MSLADIYYFLHCGTRCAQTVLPAGRQASLENNKYQLGSETNMNNELTKIYLGIDWGEKRIGLALADSETKLATPFKTVENYDEVAREVESQKVDVVVLGKPYQISDLELPISQQFEDFLSKLKNRINIPIELIDERLSSKAADALVGNKKTKASRDEIAAMIILQSYLDIIDGRNF